MWKDEKKEGGKRGAETQREHPSFNRWGVIARRQSLSNALKSTFEDVLVHKLAANRGLLVGLGA